MEEKTEYKENDNGSYTTKTTRTVTPKDGFVPDSELYEAGMDNRGKYHKGYQKNVSFTTNDPRVTRPFVYGTCALFFLIGIGCLITKPRSYFLAIMFIGMSTFAFYKSKKDIDRVQEELDKKKKEEMDEKS